MFRPGGAAALQDTRLHRVRMAVLVVADELDLREDVAVFVFIRHQDHGIAKTALSSVARSFALDLLDHHAGSRINGSFADAFDVGAERGQLFHVLVKARHFDLGHQPSTSTIHSKCT